MDITQIIFNGISSPPKKRVTDLWFSDEENLVRGQEFSFLILIFDYTLSGNLIIRTFFNIFYDFRFRN